MKKDPIGLDGQELDAWIACNIFGEKKPKQLKGKQAIKMLDAYINQGPRPNGVDGAWMCICDYMRGDKPEWFPRAFSADREEAFRIVGYLKEPFELSGVPGGEWSAKINVSAYEHAKTEAEAICRAAVVYFQDKKK